MPKLKTHKSSSKKLHARNSGSIKIGRPSSRHNTGKKSSKLNRKNRRGSTLSKADSKRLKTVVY